MPCCRPPQLRLAAALGACATNNRAKRFSGAPGCCGQRMNVVQVQASLYCDWQACRRPPHAIVAIVVGAGANRQVRCRTWWLRRWGGGLNESRDAGRRARKGGWRGWAGKVEWRCAASWTGRATTRSGPTPAHGDGEMRSVRPHTTHVLVHAMEAWGRRCRSRGRLPGWATGDRSVGCSRESFPCHRHAGRAARFLEGSVGPWRGGPLGALPCTGR